MVVLMMMLCYALPSPYIKIEMVMSVCLKNKGLILYVLYYCSLITYQISQKKNATQ